MKARVGDVLRNPDGSVFHNGQGKPVPSYYLCVTLDGKALPCVTADEEAGEAEVLVMSSGWVMRGPDDEPCTELRRGAVQITYPEEF